MTTITAGAPSEAGPKRSRRIGVSILAVLSVLGILGSTLALWTRSTLFSTSRFESSVSQTLADPAVTDAIAVFVADQAIVAVDLDGKVESVLPKELKVLEPAITGGARMLLENQLKKVMAKPEVRDVITKLAVASHGEAVRLLKGDGLGAGVTVANGEVTLNLLPLIGEGLTILQNRGLVPQFQVPDFATGTAAEGITKLSKLLGKQLPDDFGQIVVYRSETVANAEASLATAQRAVALFFRAVTLIVVVTIALIAATIALSTHRRRTIVELGIGVMVAMVLARTATERVIETLPRLLIDPGARAAAATITVDLTGSLLRSTFGLLVLGAVAALVAWLPKLIGLGRPTGTPAQMLQTHGAVLAAGLYALALITVLLFGLYLWPVLFALVLVAVGIGLQVRARPHADDADAPHAETTV